jgi:hypothetical protein
VETSNGGNPWKGTYRGVNTISTFYHNNSVYDSIAEQLRKINPGQSFQWDLPRQSSMLQRVHPSRNPSDRRKAIPEVSSGYNTKYGKSRNVEITDDGGRRSRERNLGEEA